VLTREEEFAAWQRGDHDLLIRSMLPFVVSIVVKTAKRRGYDDLDECVGEGNLALVRCVKKKFDASLGYRLSTYCRWHVWRAVDMFITQSRRIDIDESPVELHDVCKERSEETAFILNEETATLRRAVNRLQPNRKIVIEHMMDGHSLTEIGKRLGYTRSNAQAIKRLAFIDLRKELLT
jgi:RNA polymerase sigma factor (sigma-70 family)